ncbi:MAG: DMT family transporter [Pseudomonadota bacterium]|nr:DMT family transporter [Pseudomonadota bacterium]MEC8102640.1 DMT family transporter [Pseudomonadota bacterium]
MPSAFSHYRTFLLTTIAMLAFAGNSILCRLALKDDAIDPGSYTLLRMLSGALFLIFLLVLKQRHKPAVPFFKAGSWPAALVLVVYAATLSFGYVSIDTGIGALVLFGCVQISMIAISLFQGHRLTVWEVVGVLLAFAGLVYMLVPGQTAPSLMGFILMALSGIAWGVYTLLGRGSATPLTDTAGNFAKGCIPAAILTLVFIADLNITLRGAIYAVLSGTLASGAGYAIWYAVVTKLGISQAAVVQLSVPIIAAAGGVVFVGEPVTYRFIIAATLVLGGILIVILSKQRGAS